MFVIPYDWFLSSWQSCLTRAEMKVWAIFDAKQVYSSQIMMEAFSFLHMCFLMSEEYVLGINIYVSEIFWSLSVQNFILHECRQTSSKGFSQFLHIRIISADITFWDDHCYVSHLFTLFLL